MKLARLLLLPMLLLSLSTLKPASTNAEGGTLSISGVVWQDTNADGIRQPDEPGMPNVPVELGTTYNGQYFYNNAAGQPLYPGPNGRAIATDANGAFAFDSLNPGPYSVRVAGTSTFNPYLETYPLRRGAGEYSTAITLDTQSVKGVDFGLLRPSGVRIYRGLAWLDAASIAKPLIHTYVDGIDCTGGDMLIPTDVPKNAFVTGVLPESLIPGCGAPGKTVRFTINGRAARETVEWTPPPVPTGSGGAIAMPGAVAPPILPPSDPASYQRPLDISAGVPFAYVVITPVGATYFDANSISADIDGIECGRGFGEVWGIIYLLVASDQAIPGCGVDGSSVTILQAGLPVAAPLVWHSGVMTSEPVGLVGEVYQPILNSESDQ